MFSIGIPVVSFSQSGWFWQNPLPQGSTLNSVKFIDSQTGFAVGNIGAILKTTNAGENWSLYNSNFMNDIYSISFSDANTGFAVGSDGLMVKTTNSGISWQKISIGTNDTLLSIYFFNSVTGYISGVSGIIFKTADGGNNWSEQTSGTTIKLNCVYFIDSDKGFIGADSKLLRTTNGGNSWNVSDFPGIINSISFINDNTGFSVGSISNTTRDLRKTTNGGGTWLPVSLPLTPALNEIQFINSSTGFICGNGNTFFKTTNSGTNWILDNTISNDGFAFNSVYFDNIGNGYLVGTYGTVFKSKDTGNNWTPNAPSGTFESLSIVNFTGLSTGYISGYSLYKTSNGGSNWVSLNTTFSDIDGMQFLDDNTGYIQSFLNLYKSQDGGLSWNVLAVPNDTVVKFQFVDVNTGFIMNSYGPKALIKTTNGGDSWTSYSFLPEYVHNFQFPLHDIGYCLAAFNSRKLYKTNNTGLNWNFVNYMEFDSLITDDHTLYFIDEYIGFIFTEHIMSPFVSDYILKRTTNGGIDWYNVYSETLDNRTLNTLRLNFVNNSTGFILGYLSKLMKTTNNGTNWNEYNFSDRTINDIEFVNDNTGYAVGNGGLIMKTTNGGSISVENNSSLVPSSFMLKQNYPNPFNPRTIISYDLTSNNFVTLKVFDILGKEIITLFNKEQNSGSHSVEFKGENLPSGIYFYKLIVKDFSETRRMLLLK